MDAPPETPRQGYFSALLEFEDGVFPATLVYSAYGYFMASEFFPAQWRRPLRLPGLRGRVEARREIVSGTRDETAAKEQRIVNSQQPRIGGRQPTAWLRIPG